MPHCDHNPYRARKRSFPMVRTRKRQIRMPLQWSISCWMICTVRRHFILKIPVDQNLIIFKINPGDEHGDQEPFLLQVIRIETINQAIDGIDDLIIGHRVGFIDSQILDTVLSECDLGRTIFKGRVRGVLSPCRPSWSASYAVFRRSSWKTNCATASAGMIPGSSLRTILAST